jgi:phage N-6-adenine-methyltransferase
MGLIKYNEARRALAEAHSVDEVKDIRDKAAAMQEYAKQAKDTELIRYSTDIKYRAERRAGEMLIALGERRGGDTTPNSSPSEFARPSNKQLGITDNQSSRWQKQAKLADEEFEERLEQRVQKVIDTVNGEKKTRGTTGTGENEWYTPPEHLKAAREVLGDFDLDPASNEEAQKYVKAKKFFSIKDDGLKQEWRGRVWLNPPYAQPHIADFVDKLAAELDVGRVTEAIMLTHNYSDAEWFHLAFSRCSAICFTRGRVKFWNPNGEVAAPTQGQVFFYFGKDVEKFRDEFSKIGGVARPDVLRASEILAREAA